MPLVNNNKSLKCIQGTYSLVIFLLFLHSFLWIGQTDTGFVLSEKDQRLNLLNLSDYSRLRLQKS